MWCLLFHFLFLYGRQGRQGRAGKAGRQAGQAGQAGRGGRQGRQAGRHGELKPSRLKMVMVRPSGRLAPRPDIFIVRGWVVVGGWIWAGGEARPPPYVYAAGSLAQQDGWLSKRFG